jgi:hypothetical protein
MLMRIAATVLCTVLAGDGLAQGMNKEVKGINSGEAARIAQAIVGLRVLKAELPPSITQSEVFIYHEHSVINLLYLLDQRSTREDLRVLVNLSSYYLGESPAQTVSCLMIRKGKKLLPFLDEAVKSPQSACAKQTKISIQESVCIPSEILKARLAAVSKAISTGERCSEL